MVSRKKSGKIADAVIIFILILLSLLCIAPVVHSVALSFSDSAAASSGTVYFWPKKFTTSAYEELLGDVRFFKAFWVSIKRVLLGATINFFVIIFMAYPLSKSERVFRARNVYMWILVATMLFNGGMIPTYMVVKKAHLIDSIWALVLPCAVPVFNVILLMNFFKGIPKDLEEAGEIDGAGPLILLFKIYLPLSLPALTTVTLFNIINHWNAFFDGMIYINNPAKLPLQTYIQQLVVDVAKINMMSVDEIRKLNSVSDLTLNSAKIIVSVIPILVIYPFMQRYFITGIVMGAVKE